MRTHAASLLPFAWIFDSGRSADLVLIFSLLISMPRVVCYLAHLSRKWPTPYQCQAFKERSSFPAALDALSPNYFSTPYTMILNVSGIIFGGWRPPPVCAS